MKNLLRKSLYTLFVTGGLLTSSVQAATFSNLMKLGIVKANASNKEILIFNDDQTKCLSVYGENGAGVKSLTYNNCKMEGTDTWVITNVGKIKNKRTGKCLSTPAGEDNLILTHCSYQHFRSHSAHDFIVLENFVGGARDRDQSKIANVNY
jgi:hypothetical protein